MILTEHLPGANDLRGLFDALGVADCEVEPCTTPVAPSAVATYRDRSGSAVEAVVVMDLPLAASLAAALVMIPASVVDEAVADGELYDSWVENLHEVANVVASVISSPVTPGVVLADLDATGKVPAAAVPVLDSGHTARFRVSMRGYPGGTMAVHGTV